MGRLVFVLGLLGSAACATTPYVIIPEGQGAAQTSATSLLATHPLPEGQNISALALGHSEAMSYYLVQVRDREQPHLHATHDVVVTLMRGTGQLHIRGASYEMHAGDVAVVPRGTAHYFVNTGSAPAAAFATFTPPYDGKDQVPVE